MESVEITKVVHTTYRLKFKCPYCEHELYDETPCRLYVGDKECLLRQCPKCTQPVHIRRVDRHSVVALKSKECCVG